MHHKSNASFSSDRKSENEELMKLKSEIIRDKNNLFLKKQNIFLLNDYESGKKE
jgi:hypothetical protein